MRAVNLLAATYCWIRSKLVWASLNSDVTLTTQSEQRCHYSHLHQLSVVSYVSCAQQKSPHLNLHLHCPPHHCPMMTNQHKNQQLLACLRSLFLKAWETWAIRRENELALSREEMRMVRQMCGVKLSDKNYTSAFNDQQTPAATSMLTS